MKSKNQLLQELNGFCSFARSLTDLSEETLNEPLYDDVSIKKILTTIYLQDKLYLEYYFPRMNKNENIEEHDKTKFFATINHYIGSYSTKEIVDELCGTRKEIVEFLQRLSSEHMHAFFQIEGVQFTMYDHIEHLIWNDFISKEEILKHII